MNFQMEVSKEDYLEVVEDVLSNTPEGRKAIWSMRVFLLFITAMVSTVLYFVFKGFLYPLVGITVGIFTTFYHSKKDLIKRHRREAESPVYRKRFGMVSYQVEESGIWKEVGGDKQFVRWDSIVLLRKTDHHLWFKAAGNFTFIFPRKGFASDSDFENLHSRIEERRKR